MKATKNNATVVENPKRIISKNMKKQRVRLKNDPTNIQIEGVRIRNVPGIAVECVSEIEGV